MYGSNRVISISWRILSFLSFILLTRPLIINEKWLQMMSTRSKVGYTFRSTTQLFQTRRAR